ncbi:MAG: S41 family peptidase [Armatimonadota bacterium]|nr:S41 family peptidase [Armatimonadota bacterium]
MKIARILSAVITTLLILIGSFVAGFILPDAVKAENAERFIASLQLLPERIERLTDPSRDDDPNKLPIVDTYWTVLTELSEKYYGKKIDRREMTYSAIRGMLEALNDPYTRFLDPKESKDMREQNSGNFVGIGAHLDTDKKTHQVYILKPLPDSPAEKILKPGDVIIKVDGKIIAGMDIEDVVNMIRGKEGTVVKLTIQRPKVRKLLEFRIVRQVVQYRIVDWEMLDKEHKIGYIALHGFNEKSDVQFDEALALLEDQKMKALILDLRDNPGGLLTTAIDIGSRFVEGGPIVIIQERGGRRSTLDVEEEKHNHKRYPLVVLINGRSASASEIVAGAIRDNNVGTLVGTTTFGKGKVQTIVPLNDGSAVSITTARYLTPNGTDINKIGIKPDVEVENPEPTLEDMEAERSFIGGSKVRSKNDHQLIRAEKILKEKLSVASGASMLHQPASAQAITR